MSQRHLRAFTRPVSFAINIYNGVIIKLHHRLPIERGLNGVAVEKRNPKTAFPVRPVVRVDATTGRQASKHRQARGAGTSGVDPARSLPSPPRRFSRRAAEEDRGATGRSAEVLSSLSSSPVSVYARLSFRPPRVYSLFPSGPNRERPAPPPPPHSIYIYIYISPSRILSLSLHLPLASENEPGSAAPTFTILVHAARDAQP